MCRNIQLHIFFKISFSWVDHGDLEHCMSFKWVLFCCFKIWEKLDWFINYYSSFPILFFPRNSVARLLIWRFFLMYHGNESCKTNIWLWILVAISRVCSYLYAFCMIFLTAHYIFWCTVILFLSKHKWFTWNLFKTLMFSFQISGKQ